MTNNDNDNTINNDMTNNNDTVNDTYVPTGPAFLAQGAPAPQAASCSLRAVPHPPAHFPNSSPSMFSSVFSVPSV